jgi:hypothetical protein
MFNLRERPPGFKRIGETAQVLKEKISRIWRGNERERNVLKKRENQVIEGGGRAARRDT